MAGDGDSEQVAVEPGERGKSDKPVSATLAEVGRVEGERWSVNVLGSDLGQVGVGSKGDLPLEVSWRRTEKQDKNGVST